MKFFRYIVLTAFFCALLISSVPRAESDVPYVDTQTFQEKVLNASVPVLLQFDATWCPYCKKMRPVIESFFKKSAGNPLVFRLDVDHDAAVTDRYEIATLPTVILFSEGREIARHEGAMEEDRLDEWVAANLPD